MMSGGPRLGENWWEADFDATGATSADIQLDEMDMRDGPRGIKHVGTQDGFTSATTFPVPMARAATWDPALEYEVGQAIGREMRAFKYDVYLGPGVDLLRHPQWGRAQETYGEDPILAGRLGAAMVRGVQDAGTMACAKHFVGYTAEANRGDPNNPEGRMVIAPRTLWENYIRPFEIVVEESDPGCLMAAYVSVNGNIMVENQPLLTGVLRDRWKWDGFVVSDWWATEVNRAGPSANAGLDLEMPDDTAFVNLVADGVSDTRIYQAATRIINARRKFKHETSEYKNSPQNATIVNDQTHKDLARKVAEKGAVLLKNDSILPLTGVSSIVVLGPDRNRPHTMTSVRGNPSGLGDRGSSGSTPPYAISVLDGLKGHPSAAGVTITDSANAADAGTADVAIIPITMDWEDEGEGYNEGKDRRDLLLSANHPIYWDPGATFETGSSSSPVPNPSTLPDPFIKAAAQANPNVIVLLMVGSAVIMEGWFDSAKGVVQTFYPGQEGGSAIANLLFGTTNFSGKLPFTIAASPTDYEPFSNTATSVTYEYLVGYKRFDTRGTVPRFPFGFGLSYTEYTYGDPTVLCTEGISTTGRLAVEIPVTNSGAVAGEEVVQLYISYPPSATEHPTKELKAFRRVLIAPGATEPVQLVVPAKDLAHWDEASDNWVVPTGTYTLHVGPSSASATLKSTTFTVN